MKKSLAFAVILCMLASMFFTLTAAAETTEWKIGYVGQKAVSTQGENGWYYLYSKAVNQGDSFPTDTFKECVWSNKISNWKYYSPHSDGYVWCPQVVDIDKSIYNPDKKPKPVENLWFQINWENGDADEDKDGKPDNNKGVRCDPSTNFIPALKWVAPEAGEYTLAASYAAGSTVGDWQDSWGFDGFDGVTVSIYHNSTKLFNKNTGFDSERDRKISDLPWQNVNQTVSLKSGDALYFITDQNGDSLHDMSKWSITINKKASEGTTGNQSSNSTNGNTGKEPTSSSNESTSSGKQDTNSTNSNTGKEPASSGKQDTNSTNSNAGEEPTSSSNEPTSSGNQETNAANNTTGTESTANGTDSEAAGDVEDSKDTSGINHVVVDADWDYPSSETANPVKENGSSNTLWIVLAIIGGVVVIGGVVILMIVLRKRKSGN